MLRAAKDHDMAVSTSWGGLDLGGVMIRNLQFGVNIRETPICRVLHVYIYIYIYHTPLSLYHTLHTTFSAP